MWLALAPALAALAVPEFQGDPGAEVARLLATRCASCHSPGSEEPKAARKWEHAEDLAATVADRELIVPGDLDASELYQSLAFEEMPPEDSEVPPFTAAELELVATWITNGAQLPLTPGDSRAVADDAPDRSPLIRWLGHFHPLVVHFPIGLLSAALLAELLFLFSGRSGLKTAATFCLSVGAIAALPAALLGWLLAVDTPSLGDSADLHRWLGVSTAVLSLIVLFVAHRKPRWRLPLLLLIAVLVGVTGHTGGLLAYGADWLDWPG